jgi:hypothetical protein
MLKRSVTCPSDFVAEGDDWTCFTNLNVADRQPPTQNLHLCLYAREKEQVDAFHRAGGRGRLPLERRARLPELRPWVLRGIPLRPGRQQRRSPLSQHRQHRPRRSSNAQVTFRHAGPRRAFVSSADLAFCCAAFVAVLHVFAALRGLAAAYGVARHGSAIC